MLNEFPCLSDAPKRCTPESNKHFTHKYTYKQSHACVRIPDTFRYNGRTKSKPGIHYALHVGVYNLFFV